MPAHHSFIPTCFNLDNQQISESDARPKNLSISAKIIQVHILQLLSTQTCDWVSSCARAAVGTLLSRGGAVQGGHVEKVFSLHRGILIRHMSTRRQRDA